MGLNYQNLDDRTRQLMLQEFNYDIECDNCYLSKRFSDHGKNCFVEIMPEHILVGNDDSLAENLKSADCFLTHEERKTKSGTTLAKVPDTASQTFAEGEFNRFYIRALAFRALEEGKQLEVYRARASSNPRLESENLIGKHFNAEQLLTDLRENKGIDTAFGLPSGPNSGLSVKLE
ncbi:hypothetical protein [Mucilaginibacter antarcticus]|uniref:Uncharacterized protein n=1 Tax=Mucilaginibacter antarcticus TaxID=1855725 RepID=A0ABW5XPI5_9SPHI